MALSLVYLLTDYVHVQSRGYHLVWGCLRALPEGRAGWHCSTGGYNSFMSSRVSSLISSLCVCQPQSPGSSTVHSINKKGLKKKPQSPNTLG